MTYDEVQAIIDEADSNRDGRLDYAEFCHMLLSTAEDCSKASKLKASKILGKRSSASGHRTRQTGLTSKDQRQGGGTQRTEVFDRRERRREEFRSQLHSASEDQWGGRRGRKGGRHARQAFSDTVISRTSDHTPVPSSPEIPDPIPVKQIDDSPSLRNGLVNGTLEDLTPLESGPREVMRGRGGGGEGRGMSANERVSGTRGSPSPVTSGSPTQPNGETNEKKRENSRGKGVPEQTEDESEATGLKLEEQPDGVAPTRTLKDPFDITGKTPSTPKLPPLKSKGTLPPILPLVAQTTPPLEEGLQTRDKKDESFTEEVVEELEEEEEGGKGDISTIQDTKFMSVPPTTDEMSPRSPAEGSHSPPAESRYAVLDETTPPPIVNEKGEPRPLMAAEEQSTSSLAAKKVEEGTEEEEEEGGQTDHLSTRQSPPGKEGGGKEKMVAPPSSVVPAPPKRPANLEVGGHHRERMREGKTGYWSGMEANQIDRERMREGKTGYWSGMEANQIGTVLALPGNC